MVDMVAAFPAAYFLAFHAGRFKAILTILIRRTGVWFLGFYTLGVILFMHLPVAVIILFSFSDKRTLSLPVRAWTLDWYRQAFEDQRLQTGLINSLKVARSRRCSGRSAHSPSCDGDSRAGAPFDLRSSFRSCFQALLLALQC